MIIASTEGLRNVVDGNGMLFANPIPEEFSLPKEMIDRAIDQAVKEAADRGIYGHANTPFILAKIKELTAGNSLPANRALIESNVAMAANVAAEYSKLLQTMPHLKNFSSEAVYRKPIPPPATAAHPSAVKSMRGIRKVSVESDVSTAWGAAMGKHMSEKAASGKAVPINEDLTTINETSEEVIEAHSAQIGTVFQTPTEPQRVSNNILCIYNRAGFRKC